MSRSVPPLRPLRALVVDDSEIVRTQVSAYLAQLGFLVERREHADGIALAIATAPPDLIVLDVHLGDALLDGTDFLSRLRAILGPRLPPVILHSSLAREHLERTAKRLGVACVSKGDVAGLLDAACRLTRSTVSVSGSQHRERRSP